LFSAIFFKYFSLHDFVVVSVIGGGKLEHYEKTTDPPLYSLQGRY